jgi:lysozyme
MSDGFDAYTKFQTITDWAAVRRAGKTFAYFKGTDGMSTRDTADWPARASAAGIACGLYGYAQPGSAVDQYNLLLRTAMNRNAVILSPALDLEDPFVPGNTATQFAIAWLRRAAEVGQIPVFYANDSMMSYLLPTVRAAVPSVWPWIARYGAAPKNAYRTWQHSSSGQVPGIVASGVDLNTGDAPVVVSAPAPVVTPPAEQTLEVEIMERITVTPPNAGQNTVRLFLSGSPGAAVIVRPRINGQGVSKPMWVGNIFAWGSDKTGVGNNPKTNPDYDDRLTSHRRFALPGAIWADLEYSAAEPFEIDIVG